MASLSSVFPAAICLYVLLLRVLTRKNDRTYSNAIGCSKEEHLAALRDCEATVV